MASQDPSTHSDCPLCQPEGEVVLWQDDLCRVIRVPDQDYPGYCRLIWKAHVAEMTDLTPRDQAHVFAVLMAVEAALRNLYQPDKINLASFGNMVPHVHWHVIPRFRGDRHFPQPVWGTPQREPATTPAPVSDAALSTALAEAIRANLLVRPPA